MLPLHPNTGAVTVNPVIHIYFMKEGTNMNAEQKIAIGLLIVLIVSAIAMILMYPLHSLIAFAVLYKITK